MVGGSMITAIIQSILAQGNLIVVSVQFSNNIQLTYNFTLQDTQATILSKIQSDVDNMNAVVTQASNLQVLANTTLQPSVKAVI